MRRVLSFIVSFLTALAMIGPAGAVILNDGQSVIVNVDLTGATPAPPYSRVDIYGGYSREFASLSLSCSIFDGLNATGSSVAGPADCWALFQFTQSIAVDGLFSIFFTSHGVGENNIFLDNAAGINADGVRVTELFPVQYVSTSVPEPGTLALLGFALTGLAALRRRRTR